MRLRSWLVLMFSLLLAFATGLIGWLGFSSSRTLIKRYATGDFAQANTFVTHHVTDFLDDPANRLLTELTLRARRGMLKLDDDQALGSDLGERLRVNPSLAWISYSDATTGRFVGVRRSDQGDVILNCSTPWAKSASGKPVTTAPREIILNADGTTRPSRPPAPQDYDPRVYPWFTDAMAATETVWSRPYDFDEGVRGITASRSWRTKEGSAPAGVFTVDFYLTDLTRLLSNLPQEFPNLFAAILEPDGRVIATTDDSQKAILAAALSDFVRRNPRFKDNAEGNNHLVPLTAQGTIYLAALNHVDAPSGLKCVVASMERRATMFVGLDHAAEEMIEIALAALGISVVLGTIMAWRISAPLHRLGDDLASVGRFQLGDSSRPRSMVREVNQLHDAADRMKRGLRSFIKYVPRDLVRQLLASGREAALGGEIRRLTVFFSDIENFTTYSELTPPDKLVHELADYLEVVTGQLRENAGTIDKFIGDGVLAFFNAPDEVAQHERMACRATLAVRRALAAWQREHRGPAFRTRIGLHAGDVLVGNIGTVERFGYTVLGDAVNVASRLEHLNKTYGTQVLASGEVRAAAGDDFAWRHVDRAAVAGRKGGMEIYELLGLKSELDAGQSRRRDAYEKALELYFARSFEEARALFAGLAREFPADKAPALMAMRCEVFAADPPPADWDGVYAHEVK